jgi:hypothetical protein
MVVRAIGLIHRKNKRAIGLIHRKNKRAIGLIHRKNKRAIGLIHNIRIQKVVCEDTASWPEREREVLFLFYSKRRCFWGVFFKLIFFFKMAF